VTIDLMEAPAGLTGRRSAASLPQSASTTVSRWIAVRMMGFLLLSSLPILAISAHVFGVVSERTSAAVLVLPLAVALIGVITLAPHPTDGIVARGFSAGMFACLIYDGFRLFIVYVLHGMGDFIPAMGTWVTGEPDLATGAVVGYLWRYLGDAGGLGVAFFIVASVAGLNRWSNRPLGVIIAAVGYAIFPVWTGLIATVALASRGEELMFPLTPATIAVTFVGHVIFGLVLGVVFLRMQQGGRLPIVSR
jgi:hypothetical protein